MNLEVAGKVAVVTGGAKGIGAAIVKSFHQVAQVMGISTIAEFVDSEEKLVQLQSLGIDYAQGYWVARPQPFPKLQLLNTNQDVA